MGRAVRAGAVTGLGGLAILLAGCSIDTLIWGQDGAEVISTTKQLVAAAAAGDATSFVCDGSAPELREPAAWEGLRAEEPERFRGDYWPDQAALDPSWSINLSLPTERIGSGEQFPGDVFYRQTADGLCLVDIAWAIVE